MGRHLIVNCEWLKRGINYKREWLTNRGCIYSLVLCQNDIDSFQAVAKEERTKLKLCTPTTRQLNKRQSTRVSTTDYWDNCYFQTFRTGLQTPSGKPAKKKGEKPNSLKKRGFY
jgi:hypothetical protein